MTGFQPTLAVHTECIAVESYTPPVNLTLLFSPTVHRGRGAGGEPICRQCTSQQRRGTDNRTTADACAIQQHTICANPDVVTNVDSTAAWLKTLVADQPVRIHKSVVRGSQRAICGDQHVTADVDAVASIEDTARVDYRASPDDHVALAASRLQFDERIDNHVVLDDDTGSSTRVLDVGERRDAGGWRDDQHVCRHASQYCL